MSILDLLGAGGLVRVRQATRGLSPPDMPSIPTVGAPTPEATLASPGTTRPTIGAPTIEQTLAHPGTTRPVVGPTPPQESRGFIGGLLDSVRGSIRGALEEGKARRSAYDQMMEELTQQPEYTYTGGYSVTPYSPPRDVPETPTYTEDELRDMITRRVDLKVDPEVEALKRNLESIRAQADRARGRMGVEHERGLEMMETAAQETQREAARRARERGIYGTELGEAAGTRADIAHQMAAAEADTEYQRALRELEEDLGLTERQIMDEKGGLEARRGDLVSSMLDEAMMREREWGAMQEQQAFDKWLAQQQLGVQAAGTRQLQPAHTPDYAQIASQLGWQQLAAGRDPAHLPAGHQMAVGYQPPDRTNLLMEAVRMAQADPVWPATYYEDSGLDVDQQALVDNYLRMMGVR